MRGRRCRRREEATPAGPPVSGRRAGTRRRPARCRAGTSVHPSRRRPSPRLTRTPAAPARPRSPGGTPRRRGSPRRLDSGCRETARDRPVWPAKCLARPARIRPVAAAGRGAATGSRQRRPVPRRAAAPAPQQRHTRRRCRNIQTGGAPCASGWTRTVPAGLPEPMLVLQLWPGAVTRCARALPPWR